MSTDTVTVELTREEAERCIVAAENPLAHLAAGRPHDTQIVDALRAALSQPHHKGEGLRERVEQLTRYDPEYDESGHSDFALGNDPIAMNPWEDGDWLRRDDVLDALPTNLSGEGLTKDCPHCGGSGHDAIPGPTGEAVSQGPCRICEGSGEVSAEGEGLTVEQKEAFLSELEGSGWSQGEEIPTDEIEAAFDRLIARAETTKEEP